MPKNLDDQLGAVFAMRRHPGAGVEKALSIRADSSIVPMHSIQGILRPLFGKGAPTAPVIGDHPDFLHLKGTTNKLYAPITTLFMDIESSTRLGVLYAPEVVYDIKNAFICTAIEIVQAFDGHVHRIMGDAVMAYFGRTSMTPQQAAVDAVNCAAALQYFSEHVVAPRLEQEGLKDNEFGIRIGVDHGPSRKVLWASYGYPGISEVTATSFYVDAAAKLQHAAGRNQVMLGQSIVELLDYPNDLVTTKTIEREGEKIEQPYMLPNHTNADGVPINYRQYVLRSEAHLALTQLGQEHSSVRAAHPSRVTVTRTHGGQRILYLPASLPVPKGDGLLFTVTIPPVQAIDTVTFSVENHGAEAEKAGEEPGHQPYQNHQTKKAVKEVPTTVSHTETAWYRGLHYMTVTLSANGRSVYTTRVGVFVE